MYALLQHPDQLRLLRDNPDLDATATEEFLRYEGPFQRNRRIATRDVKIGDMVIEQGQLIMQFLGARNRDPAQFSDPDALDIRRSPNKHLAFGYGPHFCVGAPLGRLEASAAIRALLRRLRGYPTGSGKLCNGTALYSAG